eukprot:1139470-Pelagomonas_calceolata.AAC.2
MMYANGDVFEGLWQNDLKHGPGTYFYINRGKRFDGVWQEGVLHKCLPAHFVSSADIQGASAYIIALCVSKIGHSHCYKWSMRVCLSGQKADIIVDQCLATNVQSHRQASEYHLFTIKKIKGRRGRYMSLGRTFPLCDPP